MISKYAHILLTVIVLLFSSQTYAAVPSLLLGDKLPSLSPLLEKTSPAVVNISTRGTIQINENPLSHHPFLNDPFFQNFFEFNLPQLPKERQTESIGSGVIINSEKGYVITNCHVIENADKILITTLDKRQLKAKLVGKDKETDIAMLKIANPENLVELELGNSSDLRVGDFVVAIGNPFGLSHTVTSGIVSALGRKGLGIDGYEDFIQTDASINPGNSGGALIDLRGRLVGINTAILSRSGGNMGIGFAIPVNMVNSVVEQLTKYGEVRRGELGIRAQNVTPNVAKAMKLSAAHGAIIAQVIKDSAAEDVGLKVGDIVTAVNGIEVHDAADLRNKIGMLSIDEIVKLDILRNDQELEIEAKVRKSNSNSELDKTDITDVKYLKGASFGKIDALSPHYGKIRGVQVLSIKPESPASNTGLMEGDIITSVNQLPVGTLQELIAAAKIRKNSLLMNVLRGNVKLYLAIN